MPVHVYIAVLEHNWVIMHKQRFPAVLAGMIALVYLHSSPLSLELADRKMLFCLFNMLYQSFISIVWTVV